MIEKYLPAIARSVQEYVATELRKRDEEIIALKANAVLLRKQLDEMPVARDGKDADLETVSQLITEEVSKAVAALPPPRDGVNGGIGESAYQVACRLGFSGTEVEWVKSLSGKDAPAVDHALIVAEVLKHIPIPKDGRDGKDIDPDLILAEVMKRLPPPPKDGKDVDMDQVLALISTKIIDTVAAIPVPKDGQDGKDATPVNVSEIVHDVLEHIPTPKDGEPGKDGKDVDMAALRELIAQENEKSMNTLAESFIRGIDALA